jgi:nitrous oxide reductase accessory protein NosL
MRKTASIILTAIFIVAVFSCFECLAGEDVIGKKCDVCSKTVKDKRFAVMIKKENETLYFDDIGHALQWRAGECITTIIACDAATWAYDFYTGKRVHMRAAYYVITKDIETPSGSGMVALRDEVGAKKFLKEHGGEGPLDFDEVQERYE